MNSKLTAISGKSLCSGCPRMMRFILGLVVMVILASGCTITKSPETIIQSDVAEPARIPSGRAPMSAPENYAVEHIDLIAVDLVNALAQIDSLHPTNTVLQMQPPATNFGQALKTVLEQAGYAIRIVATGDSAAWLTHAVKPLDKESDGIRNSYLVKIGDVRLKRDYFEQKQGVTPSSDLYVIGADPRQIALNDALFNVTSVQTDPLKEIQPQKSAETRVSATPGAVLANDTQERYASGIEQPAKAIEPTQVTPIAVSPSLSDNGPDSNQSNVDTLPNAQLTALKGDEPTLKQLIDTSKNNSRVGIKGNMYELGQSNFSELLQSFSDVKKDVLVFGNDSMRLGRKNKGTLTAFITDFQQDSDVISVIGCSHGRSSLANGNSVLATGRAQRVKEALLYAGIPEDRVLEEGCWSAEYYDEVMPRRGVVITHKRERKND